MRSVTLIALDKSLGMSLMAQLKWECQPWKTFKVRPAYPSTPIMLVSHATFLSELVDKGNAQKRLAATKMNERSSRAHSIFIVSLSQRHKQSGAVVKAKLYMADLGGSEQLKKSEATGQGLFLPMCL